MASAESRAKFSGVLQGATGGGKRWDDGIYGTKTREGLRIWEDEAAVPFRDGIFRPVPVTEIMISGFISAPMYKLNILHEVYRQKMLSLGMNLKERIEVERLSMNPALFVALYKSGT